MASALALVWIVAAPLVLAMGALLCLILGLFYVLYLQPMLDWLTRRGGGFLGRLIRWVSRPLTSYVKAFVARHVALLMRSFVTGIAPLVLTLNQLTVLTQRIAGTLADMAEQTWRALWVLRHETVPRLITTALVPIRAQLTRHTNRLDALEDLNRRVAVAVASGLRELPWGSPGNYVGNFQAWLNSYAHLWRQVFEFIQPQLRELRSETIPGLARDLAGLAEDVARIGQVRLPALAARVGELEDLVTSTLIRRLDALSDAVDALAATVFEGIEVSFSALVGRIVELERAVFETIPARFETIERDLQTLRDELAEGIRTGLGAFAERVEALERQAFETIPAQIAALQLAVDTIAAEVFEEVGAGLTALTTRIEALERRLSDVVMPQLDLVLGRIEALETRIETDVLPRLRALEDLLAPAAFAALVLATMRAVAPNLFCRNVTDTTRRVCAEPEDFWAQLLGGALVFAIALNPREVAQAGQALTGILGGVIRETIDH